MTRVLIVGADGLIGAHLALDMERRGWDVIGTTRRSAERRRNALELDLATIDPETFALPDVDIAIFAAAMTRFADCRAAPDLARRINLETPVALARRFAKRGTRSILLSTSAVFDGAQPRIRADAPTSPASVYGVLKAEAEVEFRLLGTQGSVVRLTKVLSEGNALMTGWIAALRRGEPVDAFDDLRLSPITLQDVTVAILTAAASGGLLQVSGAEDIAYADAALHFAIKLNRPANQVRRITAAERGIPESECPRYAMLDTTGLAERTDWHAPAPYDLLDALFLDSAD